MGCYLLRLPGFLPVPVLQAPVSFSISTAVAMTWSLFKGNRAVPGKFAPGTDLVRLPTLQKANRPPYPSWRTLEKINASHQETQIGKNKGIRWYKGRSWNHRLLGLPSSYCLAPSAPGGPPFGPGFLLEDSKTAKEDPMAEHIFWCNVFRWQSIASRFAFFFGNSPKKS